MDMLDAFKEIDIHFMFFFSIALDFWTSSLFRDILNVEMYELFELLVTVIWFEIYLEGDGSHFEQGGLLGEVPFAVSSKVS